MEYSVDFKNMVKAHQGKFIGYGNPNAPVLIIVPKIDDDRLSVYNVNNSCQWLKNIENQTDFNDVKDFFYGGEQVGDESTFNPLFPFKGQRDVIVKKKKNGDVCCIDGTCRSWHRYQYVFSDLRWDLTDKIEFFKYAFYTVFDEELIKEKFFHNFSLFFYAYQSITTLFQYNPSKVFNMKHLFGELEVRSRDHTEFMFQSWDCDSLLIATLPYDRLSNADLKHTKFVLESNIYRYADGLIIKDDGLIRKYIDMLATGEFKDIYSKRLWYSRVFNTILANILRFDAYKWSKTWIYAFHKLKDDKNFYSPDKDFDSVIDALPSIFLVTPKETVREIVSDIVKKNKEYYSLLIEVIDRCDSTRWHMNEKIKKRYIPKQTYQELMDVFSEIKSTDYKTMLVGKLIWLKYQYRKKFGKTFEY